MCADPTPLGLEPMFPSTVARMPTLAYAQEMRDQLNPKVELHLTESGGLCNAPKGSNPNNYSAFYTMADFTRTYWVANAAQWLYQYLLSAEAADLATVAQSQILGFPAEFDGLSGEWPCGSMVDWTENKMNHKFWVMIALLQSVSRPFSYCSTTAAQLDNGRGGAGAGNADVYAQGLRSEKGRVVVLINTKSTVQSVIVPGAAGKHAGIIDTQVGNDAAREVTISSDTVELRAFATVFIHWSNATLSQ